MQKATVGGILSIISGAFGLLTGLFSLIYVVLFSFMFNTLEEGPSYTASGAEPFLLIFWLIFGFTFLYYFALGALAVVGGICAIKKKAWGWALAGAIAGSMAFYYVGIAAVVLVAMSKPEFNKPAMPTAVV